MPQLDFFSFKEQIIYTLGTFSIFYYIIAKVLIPHLSSQKMILQKLEGIYIDDSANTLDNSGRPTQLDIFSKYIKIVLKITNLFRFTSKPIIKTKIIKSKKKVAKVEVVAPAVKVEVVEPVKAEVVVPAAKVEVVEPVKATVTKVTAAAAKRAAAKAEKEALKVAAQAAKAEAKEAAKAEKEAIKAAAKAAKSKK
jgi:hypothetical protein